MNMYNAALITTIKHHDPEDIFFEMSLEIIEDLPNGKGERLLLSLEDGFWVDPYVLGAESTEWVCIKEEQGTKDLLAIVTEEGFKVFDPTSGAAVPAKKFFNEHYEWLLAIGETANRVATEDDSAAIKRRKAAHEASLTTQRGVL
jgi:hypothetical protein